MRVFLAILLRCALALGLALVPVVNAMGMAAMAASLDDSPPCHAPAQQQDGNSGHVASQCHCAMATCLPTTVSPVTRFSLPSDHPQTVRPLAFGQASVPEIPPPQPQP